VADVGKTPELPGNDVEAAAGIARPHVEAERALLAFAPHRDAADFEAAPLDKAQHPQHRAFGHCEVDLDTLSHRLFSII
jgi:hypothetical protein